MSISEARRREKTRRKVRMPSLSFIVARSYPDNVIGCENQLPWRLSSDLRRFRNITINHAVVMGRKTFESIGRMLPHRYNVILSRGESQYNEDYAFVENIESAQFAADMYSILNGHTEYFIIGGANIYEQFSGLIQKIYLTEVFTGNLKGDAYFDYKIDKRNWRLIQEDECAASDSDDWPSRFSVYVRKDNFIRTRDVIEFMTYDQSTDAFVSRMLERYRHNKPRDTRADMEQILLPFMIDE